MERKHCGRQFVESYSRKGYSDDAKQLCLKMYLNGMGFRGIERVTGINHNTIINWARQAGITLPDAPRDILDKCGQPNDRLRDHRQTNYL